MNKSDTTAQELREYLILTYKYANKLTPSKLSPLDSIVDSSIDRDVELISRMFDAYASQKAVAARIDGMQQAKSRVLRRTEIPKDARNPTRDATVLLGEAIADIIQGDIDNLTQESEVQS